MDDFESAEVRRLRRRRDARDFPGDYAEFLQLSAGSANDSGEQTKEADVSMDTEVEEAVRATNAIIAANSPASEPREQHPFEATTQQLVTELRQAAATLLNEAQRVSSETDAICDNLVAGMKKKAMEITSHTDRVMKLREQMNAVIDEYQGRKEQH